MMLLQGWGLVRDPAAGMAPPTSDQPGMGFSVDPGDCGPCILTSSWLTLSQIISIRFMFMKLEGKEKFSPGRADFKETPEDCVCL